MQTENQVVVTPPIEAKIAAWIWVVRGAYNVGTFPLAFFTPNPDAWLYSLIPLLVGSVFIYLGIQTLRGAAADILGNAIGSLIWGLVGLSRLSLQAAFLPVAFKALDAMLLLSLLLAGTLGLIARSRYKAWAATRS